MDFDAALKMRPGLTSHTSSGTADAVRRIIERVWCRVRHVDPESTAKPVIAALAARVESLAQEIDRLTRLAAQEQDVSRQEALLALAQDLQREAHGIREQIRRIEREVVFPSL